MTDVNMWHNQDMNTKAPSKPIIVPQVAPYAPSEELGEYAQLFKALSEPMRLGILRMIVDRQGEAVCACDFPDALGITQPTASHHLKRLTEAGLLSREQRGKWAWFSIVPDRVGTIQNFLDQIIRINP